MADSDPQPPRVEIDALWFLYDIPRIPCLKHSVSWGFATGSLLSLHRYYTSKNIFKAVQMGLAGFIVISPISWHFCRKRYTSRRDALKATMDFQKKRKQLEKENQQNNQKSN